MDELLESLYLLILLLTMWGFSFVVGILLGSNLFMVVFFWIAALVTLIIYSFFYTQQNKDARILKKQMILLLPIWLFLIYQSYFTIRDVQMSSTERWALIPFVLGLGFTMALLKLNIEKK